MVWGQRKLCSTEADLHRSHIFPAGLYKRFISDLTAGGSFLSLKEGHETNRQFVRFWFCSACEARLKRGEDAYFHFLEARSASSHYDEALYYFAVSISWRCALFYFDESPGIEWVDAALEKWRLYLIAEATEAEPYSQYLVSLEAPAWKPWNQGIGGFAMPNLNLVLSLVGPFMILGLSQPDKFTDVDRALLDSARLVRGGGRVSRQPSVAESISGVESVRIAVEFLKEASTNRMVDIEQTRQRGKRRRS